MVASVVYDHDEYSLSLTFDDPGMLLDAYAALPGLIDAAVRYVGQYVVFGGTIDINVVVTDTATGRFAGGPFDVYTYGQADDGKTIVGVSLVTEAQSGEDRNPDTYDLRIEVPTDAAYLNLHWIDPNIANSFSGAPPTDKVDLFSVIVHEILHGMGVTGYRDMETGEVSGSYVSVFDTFVEVLDGQVTFSGPAVTELLGGPLELRVGGSQGIYHLGAGPMVDDSAQRFLESDNLNSYYYYTGERYSIGLLDLAILSDLGWEIRENSLTSVTNLWEIFDNAYFLVGGDEGDTLNGYLLHDRLEGRGGNDELRGFGGDDLIDGGPGIDIALYGGKQADYDIVQEAGGVRVTDHRDGLDADGSDLLLNVETLRFRDGDLDISGMLANLPPDAVDDDATTFRNVAISIDVLANDIDPNDGDDLSVSALAGPLHGTIAVNPDNSITYTPDQGFTGSDSFTYVVADQFNATSIGVVAVSVLQPVNANEWRLFTSDGYEGTIGGSGSVFGTDRYQRIVLDDRPGTVTFDPSFNRGGDIIDLPGIAGSWQVFRSGSNAVFTDGDTSAVIPVGTQGIRIAFDDGLRALVYDTDLESMRIGSQSFSNELVPISAPAQDFQIPVSTDPDATARLFLAEGADVSVGGKLEVIGTRGAEHVELLGGEARFDPSFNAGGDEIAFPEALASYSATVTGSAAIIESNSLAATIPVGTVGIDLNFANTNAVLYYDAGSGSVLLGDLVIYPPSSAVI
ncbi:MAG: cadherin-like domain-containing protein [Novosphingobium sp.]|nr:cadherin-like domain-containing protein [Novosphingobium sp.]